MNTRPDAFLPNNEVFYELNWACQFSHQCITVKSVASCVTFLKPLWTARRACPGFVSSRSHSLPSHIHTVRWLDFHGMSAFTAYRWVKTVFLFPGPFPQKPQQFWATQLANRASRSRQRVLTPEIPWSLWSAG